MDLAKNVLNLNLEGIVEIPQCGIYAKSPEALDKLFDELKRLGYDVKDCSQDRDRPAREEQEKNGWYLWYASLRDDVRERKGQCRSCCSYISMTGIALHKHKCEVCGQYTYLKFLPGDEITFCFAKDNLRPRGGMRTNITLKIFGYDDATGRLLLYPEPIVGDLNERVYFGRTESPQTVIAANEDKFERLVPYKYSKSIRKHVRRLKAAGKYSEVKEVLKANNKRPGFSLIAIKHNPASPYVDVIDTHRVSGGKCNYRGVILFNGKAYSEWDRLPIPESFSIYEAWHYAPLEPSVDLHEKIIHAAGMVTDCGYYYQDGRAAFFDIHLLRMRLFVENLTTIDIAKWDEMIKRASKSGPGMIKAIAAFCQGKEIKQASVKNEPNICNLIIGMSKIGEEISADEMEAMIAAAKSEDVMGNFHNSMKI